MPTTTPGTTSTQMADSGHGYAPPPEAEELDGNPNGNPNGNPDGNPNGNPPTGTPRGGSGSSGGKNKETYDFRMPGADPGMDAQTRQQLSEELNPERDPTSLDRVDYYDRTYLTDLANQQIETAREQYNQQIDRAMDTQARDLNRALADAQGQFQEQQNQIALDERNAMDNAALYAQARGDKGGIGAAQYNSVQNTAAKNRQSVREAQTKLATDTARQISDLRAQGEFERADKMLELTQTYLSELRAIEEYAANYNLSVDQMNTAIAQWEEEFNRAAEQYRTQLELTLTQMTGMWSDGTPTREAQQQTQQAQAQLALSLIQSGVHPDKLSKDQLTALQTLYGMSRSQIITLYKKSKKQSKKK